MIISHYQLFDVHVALGYLVTVRSLPKIADPFQTENWTIILNNSVSKKGTIKIYRYRQIFFALMKYLYPVRTHTVTRKRSVIIKFRVLQNFLDPSLWDEYSLELYHKLNWISFLFSNKYWYIFCTDIRIILLIYLSSGTSYHLCVGNFLVETVRNSKEMYNRGAK
jgi:hypothetical protein